MIGWIRRRLLARKTRKALASVKQYEADRSAMRGIRPAPSASVAPAHHDPLGINQALLLSSVMGDSGSASASCSSSFSSDSFSSYSGGSSCSSDSSSSSGSWD